MLIFASSKLINWVQLFKISEKIQYTLQGLFNDMLVTHILLSLNIRCNIKLIQVTRMHSSSMGCILLLLCILMFISNYHLGLKLTLSKGSFIIYLTLSLVAASLCKIILEQLIRTTIVPSKIMPIYWVLIYVGQVVKNHVILLSIRSTSFESLQI